MTKSEQRLEKTNDACRKAYKLMKEIDKLSLMWELDEHGNPGDERAMADIARKHCRNAMLKLIALEEKLQK